MDTLIKGVLIPLLAVGPGFVLAATYRRQRQSPDPSDPKFVATSLIASLLPHALLIRWTYEVIGDFDRRGFEAVTYATTIAWVFCLVGALPWMLGLILSWLVDAEGLQGILGIFSWSRAARTRTAWAWAFSPEVPAWLLVTTGDGQLRGGQYGEGAFASLELDDQDLYLTDPHVVDNAGQWTRMNAQGLWIRGENIVSIEFYEGNGEALSEIEEEER